MRPPATAVLVVLAVLVLVTVAACGRFGTAEDASPTTTRPATTAAEATSTTTGTATPSSSTSTTASPTTVAPVRATTTSTDPRVVRDGIENRSTVETGGWRIVVTVGERDEHFTDERILFEVALTNITDRVRHHEVRQPDLIVISHIEDPERAVWGTRWCNPTYGVPDSTGGLRAVEPGETVPFQTEYPLDCQLSAGTYAVFGQVAVCPDDARIETPNPGTYRCAEDRVELLPSLGVPLRLVDR